MVFSSFWVLYTWLMYIVNAWDFVIAEVDVWVCECVLRLVNVSFAYVTQTQIRIYAEKMFTHIYNLTQNPHSIRKVFNSNNGLFTFPDGKNPNSVRKCWFFLTQDHPQMSIYDGWLRIRVWLLRFSNGDVFIGKWDNNKCLNIARSY